MEWNPVERWVHTHMDSVLRVFSVSGVATERFLIDEFRDFFLTASVLFG